MIEKVDKALRSWIVGLVPGRLLRQVFFEARVSLRTASSRRANMKRWQKMEDIKVNVGCGPHPLEGWVNLDIISDPRVDYWDCRKGLPFKDGAAKLIYTEHFLEHLNYGDELHRFLDDCFRCLDVKGTLRIVVPDAETYLRLYANNDWEGLAKVRPLTKDGDSYRDYWLKTRYATKMELINAVFRQDDEHKYAYDAETLIHVLRAVGFSRVVRMNYGESASPEMPAGHPDRRSESLYVEASKS